MEHKTPKVCNLTTPRRSRLTSLVVRGTAKSVARYCMAHPYYSKAMIQEAARQMIHELKVACSDTANSILSSKETSALLYFDWKLIADEAKQHSPMFFALLESMFDFCNELQKSTLIGVVYAIVCQSYRETMNLFQRLISVILYAGHCSKQVLHMQLTH